MFTDINGVDWLLSPILFWQGMTGENFRIRYDEKTKQGDEKGKKSKQAFTHQVNLIESQQPLGIMTFSVMSMVEIHGS